MRNFFVIFIAITSLTACDKLNPLNLLAPKDASKYASKLAAGIADRPECQSFKDQIMAHSSGKMTEGKTVGPIVQAHQDAIKAGCGK